MGGVEESKEEASWSWVKEQTRYRPIRCGEEEILKESF